jgi:hypothetical protein
MEQVVLQEQMEQVEQVALLVRPEQLVLQEQLA